MDNEGLQNLGKVIDPEGQTIIELFAAPNALTEGAGTLSTGLYVLSETIIRGILPGFRGGGLGGEFGYGADFENDVFMMHPFCWCEKNDGSCLWCVHSDNPQFMPLLNARFGTTEENYYNKQTGYFDPPHFWHKSSDFRVRWYKWIGRDMVINRELTAQEWIQVFTDCWESLSQETRDKAVAEHDRENTPESLAERQREMERFFEAMPAVEHTELPF